MINVLNNLSVSTLICSIVLLLEISEKQTVCYVCVWVIRAPLEMFCVYVYTYKYTQFAIALILPFPILLLLIQKPHVSMDLMLL